MTLGNFALELSNRDIAKRLVGYMPALQGTKDQRKNTLYKKAAAHVYHTSFAEILASVIRVQQNGGTYFSIHGEEHPRLMMPLVAFIVQDLPEGHLLTGTMDSGSTPRPCISCLVGVDQVDKPVESCAATKSCPRTASGMKAVITALAKKLRTPEPSGPNCKTQLEETARTTLSAHIMPNAFWDVDFGTDNGIYGAVVPDRMHEWWEGIVKYTIDHVVELCAEHYQRSCEAKKRDREREKVRSAAIKLAEAAARAATAEEEVGRLFGPDLGRRLTGPETAGTEEDIAQKPRKAKSTTIRLFSLRFASNRGLCTPSTQDTPICRLHSSLRLQLRITSKPNLSRINYQLLTRILSKDCSIYSEHHIEEGCPAAFNRRGAASNSGRASDSV